MNESELAHVIKDLHAIMSMLTVVVIAVIALAAFLFYDKTTKK